MNNTTLGWWEGEVVEDKVPPLLYAVMGLWASFTGLTGFLANSLAIGLFCSTSKVSQLYQGFASFLFTVVHNIQDELDISAICRRRCGSPFS
jgi:hypothetical protein